MKSLYFILSIWFVIGIVTLIISNLKYNEYFGVKKYSKSGKKLASKKVLKKKDDDDEDDDNPNNPFHWPNKGRKKVTHTHPTLLYYDNSGNILPVKHGHKLTYHKESSFSIAGIVDSLMLRPLINNAKHVMLKGKKNKKKDRGAKYHYTMPLPVDEDNNIIDITKSSNLLSPALWSNVDDSEAEGYLYPYNITNRFNENAIDVTKPYGEQVHEKLKYSSPDDLRYFQGKKHTHHYKKKKGLAIGSWHLKKRRKKNVEKQVTKDMCVYESVDSTKYTVVRDGKKKRDKAINKGSTERTLAEARNLVNDSNWSYCAKDTSSDSDSCVCLPGSCSFNSYGGAGGRPLNACIYQGSCEVKDGESDNSSSPCSNYSDSAGTTGNKNSCEANDYCTWEYSNKDCSTYEDTYTNQDTCSSYNVDDSSTDQGVAETTCTSNPWCYWGS